MTTPGARPNDFRQARGDHGRSPFGQFQVCGGAKSGFVEAKVECTIICGINFLCGCLWGNVGEKRYQKDHHCYSNSTDSYVVFVELS